MFELKTGLNLNKTFLVDLKNKSIDQNLTSILANSTNPSNSSNNSSTIMPTHHQTDTDASLDGNWYDIPRMDNLANIFTVCCSTAMIFGGIIPYVPQYLKIKRSMNSDGFSTYVCLTLLLANIMRIIFWFGHRFELPLLIQSFVIIIGMIVMMELCIRVRRQGYPDSIAPSTSLNGSQRHRFLNGKIEDNADERDDESMPIQSVLSATTSSISITSGAADTVAIINAPTPGLISLPSHNQHLNIDAIITNEALDTAGASVIFSDDTIRRMPDVSSNLDYQNDHINYGGGGEGVSISSISSNSHQAASYSPHLSQTTSLLGGSHSEHHPRNIKCSSDSSNFWNWDNYFSYVKFLSMFTFIAGLLTYLLLDNYLYIETLGFIAVFTESMLGMPQLVRNHRKRSTKGMSVEMVIMWLSGDLFKTLYSIIRRAPRQFYVCGSIQVVVDILILCQVFWFRKPNVTYRKLPKST